MAKKVTSKTLFEGFKSEVAKKVIEDQTGERVKAKSGYIAQRHIDAIPDEDMRNAIQARFDAYIEAVKEYNKAKDESAIAKYNLQAILSGPLVSMDWISDHSNWEIEGIKNGNILFKDSDTNWQDKQEAFIQKKVDNAPISEDNSWAKYTVWQGQEIPEAMEISSSAYPEPTPEDNQPALPPLFEGNEDAYLNAFRGIKGRGRAERRVKWFQEMLSANEVHPFLDSLQGIEQRELIDALDEKVIKDLEIDVDAA